MVFDLVTLAVLRSLLLFALRFLKGLFFVWFFLSWFVCLYVFYFGLTTGMASEMFSLLCVGCIKGAGTFLDSVTVTQSDRYTPSSFHSILLSHAGVSERF